MKALKLIGALVGASVLVILALGNVLPKDYRVVRSIEIAAPPERVFPEVDSLRKWNAWSPWIARDPSIANVYEGPDHGVGASVRWTSDDSGTGSQRITRSEPHTRIETALEFGGQGTANADFDFEPTATGTRVTWGMTGEVDGPIGGVFASRMEAWIGPDYEKGLLALKAHVEGLPLPGSAVIPALDAALPPPALDAGPPE